MCGLVGCTPLLRAEQVTPSQCMSNSIYLNVVALHEQGRTALSIGQFKEAMRAFERGIELLGDKYVDENLIDDSGMKLTVAKIEEEKGNLEVSANIKYRVLTSRLEVFRIKLKCE